MSEFWNKQLQPHSDACPTQEADGTASHRSLLHDLDVATRKLLSRVRSGASCISSACIATHTLHWCTCLSDRAAIRPQHLGTSLFYCWSSSAL
jgi:hypothetical protein